MRTPEAILARLKELEESNDDFFGFQRNSLIAALPFEQAKPFLKDGVTAEQWELEADPAKQIREYLSFAWEKANDCRGLSAARSLSRFAAWLWLMGDDDVSWLDDYTFYGKPHLVTISERVGFPWREHDDGKWRNSELEPGISAAEALGQKV